MLSQPFINQAIALAFFALLVVGGLATLWLLACGARKVFRKVWR